MKRVGGESTKRAEVYADDVLGLKVASMAKYISVEQGSAREVICHCCVLHSGKNLSRFSNSAARI